MPIYKPLLKEPETFRQRYVLYRYAARLLLERVSWFCRDHRIANDPGDGSAEVIFSNRAGMSYDELRDYMEILQTRTRIDDVRIDWSVIRPDRVRAMAHERMMGLQIADAVASSFYYAVQTSPYGFTEPRYAQMLKPVVYHRERQFMGYGIKLWPREAQELPDTVPELAWMKQTYG